jgi:hypothetical protein
MLTYPHDGVMATRPATAPEAPPSVVDFPFFTFSIRIQPSRAMAVAVLVLTKAWADRLLAARADPALNPNQPNHSIPAPSTVKGTLWGFIGVPGHPLRFLTTSSRPRPPMAALMCTTVPPAKSSAPRWNNQPLGSNTQWAIGAYTMIDHTTMNVQ